MDSAHVNGSQLSNCIGKTVSIIGKIKIIHANKMEAIATLSDGIDVTLKLYEHSKDLIIGCYFHAIVRVDRIDTLITQKLVPFISNNFDMNLYNEAVKQVQRFPILFKEKSII